MRMTPLYMVLLFVLLIGAWGCASGSPGEDATVTPTNPPSSANPTPVGTSASSGCFADGEFIQKSLDTYHEVNGAWPTIDGRPGDIQWDKLVPAFIDHVPATDASCDWQVNTAPEGRVCLRDKANKGSDCYCGSVCTETATPSPDPNPNPTPTATTPISSMKTTGELVWASNWDEAQRRAQAENKPIMIVFYTDVCPYCKKLFNNTLPDEQLSLFLSTNFITIKSNTQKEKLHSSYDVKSVPTTVFVTPQGEEIPDTRMIGNRTVDTFRTGAEKALAVWSGEVTIGGNT